VPKFRNVDYQAVVKLLEKIGYVKDRQESSHITMKADAFKSKTDEDIITVQAHDPLVIKAVNNTLKKASEQTGIPVKKLKQMLDNI
jgi:predicted RNA binding protein YcfA (HicA-like mRNA interferase family)